MSVLTSQKIALLYEQFIQSNLAFSKEVIQVTGLVANQTYIKCGSFTCPCVIYSVSFQGARIIASTKTGLITALQDANNMGSLRFCFNRADSQLSFFVSIKAISYTPYNVNEDTAVFNLQFTQRPPEDLIEIVGLLFEADHNAEEMRGARITINEKSLRRLMLSSHEVVVFIQSVPRRCMLRELSFYGAKVVIMGVAKFLMNKEVGLKIEFNDPYEGFLIQGVFSNSENVDGRKDLVVLSITFITKNIPIGYKMRISSYLSSTHAEDRGDQQEAKNAEEASLTNGVISEIITARSQLLGDTPS
ncbi:putative Cyclic di-GMP binding protein [Pillotina sp. SPG140]|jgi:hypothetical protein